MAYISILCNLWNTYFSASMLFCLTVNSPAQVRVVTSEKGVTIKTHPCMKQYNVSCSTMQTKSVLTLVYCCDMHKTEFIKRFALVCENESYRMSIEAEDEFWTCRMLFTPCRLGAIYPVKEWSKQIRCRIPAMFISLPSFSGLLGLFVFFFLFSFAIIPLYLANSFSDLQ